MSAHDWFMHGVLAGLALGCIAAWLGRRSRNRERQKQARTFPAHGGEVTVTTPMSESDYEALKTRWQALHDGNTHAHHVTPLCTEHDVLEWACVFNPRTGRMEHFKRPWPGCRIDFAGSARHGLVDPLPRTPTEETP